MAVTTLPSSLSSSRGVAASAGASRAGCVSSRRRINPTRIESSTAPAAKEPKRPRSFHGDEPPAKRRRAGETDASSGPGPTRMMSAAEKDGINRLLISLLPPGCSPHEVYPLPDSVVSVLQENGTRRGGGADADEEIEVDVYTLGDEALRVIKDGVGAYVEGRAPLRREEEAPSQSKEGVTGLSGSRSILSRTAPKNIPSRAAPKRISPRSNMPTSLEAAQMRDPFKFPFMRTPPRTTSTSTRQRAVSKSSLPRSVPTSIPSAAEFNSIPLPAKSSSIPLPVKSNSIPLPVKSNSISLPAKTAISQSLQRSATLTVSTPLPVLPKALGSRETHVKTGISESPQKSAPATACSSLPALPKLFGSTESLNELLYAANKACEKVVARRQEIEKLRAAARQEVEQMIRTVEFNDPYIDYTDMFK